MPVFYNLNYYVRKILVSKNKKLKNNPSELFFKGFYTLWKGCFSMAAYNGITTILESILSEVTSCEK